MSLTLLSEFENQCGFFHHLWMNSDFPPLLFAYLWDYYHLTALQAQLGMPFIDHGLLYTNLKKKKKNCSLNSQSERIMLAPVKAQSTLVAPFVRFNSS